MKKSSAKFLPNRTEPAKISRTPNRTEPKFWSFHSSIKQLSKFSTSMNVILVESELLQNPRYTVACKM